MVARQLKQAQEEAQRTDRERELVLEGLLTADRELEAIIRDLQRIRLELAQQSLNGDLDLASAQVENGTLDGVVESGRTR
ncbi:MAG: hypothetical protein IMX00_08945 [Limnochordales bacterium]|nr:hypothetical protein [Limnochordales bacterium]